MRTGQCVEVLVDVAEDVAGVVPVELDVAELVDVLVEEDDEVGGSTKERTALL